MKTLISILFIFISSFSFAQPSFFKVTLETACFKRKPPYTRIDLFIENDSTAIVEIRTKPLANYMFYQPQRPKADTSYIISIGQFNKVIELINSLSIKQLIIGMNPRNPGLWYEPRGFKLTIKVMQESIIVDIKEPGYNTEERNLEQFLAICKEILLLAKKKPRDYF